MRAFIIAITLLASTSAMAQQQTPSEQALGEKLLQEIQAGLSCGANLIAMRSDLAKANARIKELEPKPEEKK